MSFKELIKIKKTGNKDDFQSFINETLENKEKINNDFCRTAIHTFTENQSEFDADIDSVISLFEIINPKKEADYSLMIRIFSKSSLKIVERLFSEMINNGIEPHYRTYVIMMENYITENNIFNTLLFFSKIRECWYKNEALEKEYRFKEYNTLFSFLGRTENIHENDDIFWPIINNFVEDIDGPLTPELFKNFSDFMSLTTKITFKKVSIKKSGHCKCRNKLISVELPKDRHEALLYDIKNLVSKKFKNFINSVKYDCVIDAANIGYSRVEGMKWKNKMNFDKIDSVVKTLRKMGKNPLIIIHRRHNKPDKTKYFERWRKMGKVFTTPYDNNDDWYWLYAVLIKNRAGLFVVTNDEMRDHSFQSKTHKNIYLSDFDKFRERHQAKYELKCNNKGLVCKINKPLEYSIRPQIIYSELTGSDNKEIFHIPVSCDIRSLIHGSFGTNNGVIGWNCSC